MCCPTFFSQANYVNPNAPAGGHTPGTRVWDNVIKDINVPGSTSQEMTESKLLDLVNSRSVVCQPWTKHPTLAKKVVYSWKNGILKRLRTSFNSLRMTKNFQVVLAVYFPAMH